MSSRLTATTLIKNLETLVCVSPSPLIGYYNRLSAPKYAWLNIGEREGRIWVRTKLWRVNVRNFREIREKPCLFQRFVTSIVFSRKRGNSNSFSSRRHFWPSMENTCFFPVQQEIFSMLNYFLHIREVKDGSKGININVLNIEAMIKTCVKMSGRCFNLTFWRHIFQLL